MLPVEPFTTASGVIAFEPKSLQFGVIKTIRKELAPQIEEAVMDFIRTSHVPKGVDLRGFFNQTLQTIAAASVLGGPGDLWIGTKGDELVTYILAHVGNDYDGRLAYTVSQAWVKKHQRGQRWVKDAWEQVRERAKSCFCKHFVVLSSRGNDKAYCRFLGKGFHYHGSILKEEF